MRISMGSAIASSKKYSLFGVLKSKTAVTFAILAAFIFTTSVQAIVAPAPASFAYDLYDVAINDILTGAPGFVGGVLIMVMAGLNLTRNWVVAVAGLLGGTILINADTITASMGYLI